MNVIIFLNKNFHFHSGIVYKLYFNDIFNYKYVCNLVMWCSFIEMHSHTCRTFLPPTVQLIRHQLRLHIIRNMSTYTSIVPFTSTFARLHGCDS